MEPRIETFMRIYREQLTKAVAEHPTEYAFDSSQVPTVCARMRSAFENGSFNVSGYAIKATCKIFGIKQTHKAINAYLAEKRETL